MADPKYANLVGIAYDQPDVYETKDLPEADQNAEIFEEDTDSIERLHINASSVLSKFKGKSLDASNVDFSDRLSRRIRTGYNARSGDWELAGDGEKETPIQKYQRLHCEMQELMEEVANLKEVAKDEADKPPCTAINKQVEVLKTQLTELRLEEQLGVDLMGLLSDPQSAQFKKLLSQLEQFQSPQPGGKHPGAGDGSTAVVNFQLSQRSSLTQLDETARLAELEQRLARIEQVVGATPAKLSRLGGGQSSLLDTAQQLASRAALLDTAQLDTAESRLTSLLSRLDQVADRTSQLTGNTDPDKDKKINELYDLAKKAENLSHVLPSILDRLMALQALHQQEAEFAKSVGEVESVQVQLTAKVRANAELLASVKEDLQTNLVTIKDNIHNLEKRITTLDSKK